MSRRSWKAVSLVFSVPVVTTLIGLLVLRAVPGTSLFQMPALVFFVFYVIAPVVITGGMYWTGKIHDLEVMYRQERLRPLMFEAVSSLVGLITFLFLGVHWAFIGFGVGHLVLISLLYAVTKRWKISIHGATMGALLGSMLVLARLESPFILPFIVLVGISRVKLRYHTTKQYIVGTVLGMIVMLTSFLAMYPLFAA